MGTLHKQFSLFLLLLVSCTVTEEAISSHTIHYEPGYSYQYHFSSQFTVSNQINLATSMEVELYLVSEDNELQQIAMKLSPLTLTWQTQDGTSNVDQPFDTMENWFSFYREYRSGRVKTIRYLQSESSMVLTVKRSIAGMLSLESHTTDNSTEEEGTRLVQKFHINQENSKKDCVKVFNFDKTGSLIFVLLTEELIHESSQANFMEGLSSTSNLTLIRKERLSSLTPPPSNTINSTLSMKSSQPEEKVPLSLVRQDIIRLVSCQETSPICRQDLVDNLRLLSDEDLSLLIKQMTKSSTTTVMMSLIDTLITSTDSILTNKILTDLLAHVNNDQLIQRILHYMTVRGAVPSNSVAVVERIKYIADSGAFNEATRRQAILTLGAIARTMKQITPGLSLEIVQYLHDRLQQKVAAAPSELEDTLFLIDGIGNAGHSSSQKILHNYIKNNASANIQHAAIRALRHHHDSKTADLLEDIGRGEGSRLVRHAAVSLYHRHPLAKREVMEDMRSRLIQRRSSSDLMTNDYNTTMPPVHWSTHFGDDNISISLDRTVMNHFNLQTDLLSTRYDLSIRDEATFTADLVLSSGADEEQFLHTELCLDGRVSYDTNMLKDYSHGGIKAQYETFTLSVDQLIQSFTNAYDSISTTQSPYSTLHSNFTVALSSVEDRFSQSFQNLSQFYTSLESISDTIDQKNDIFDLSLSLNTSVHQLHTLFMNTKDSIPLAVSRLSYDLLSVLTPDGQPFTTSSLYLPYLRFAPQTALANIYELYWKTQRALVQLQSDIDAVKVVTGKFGSNKQWTNPSLSLWAMRGQINDIHDLITLELSATEGQPQYNQLLPLSTAISNYLQPALTSVLQASDPLDSQTTYLDHIFDKTNNAFDQLTTVYESTRSTLDTIFGQVVHPGFPIKYKSCDQVYGCGSYPSTTGGLYRNGIDLQGDTNMVIAPFSGYIKLFNISSLGNSSSLYSYNATNTVMLRLTEFSLQSYTIILSNINPSSDITDSEVFVKGGTVIGTSTVLNPEEGGHLPTLHMEAYKQVDSTTYPQNPSQFIPRSLNPSISLDWNCNEIVTMIRGTVVNMIPIVTNNVPSRNFIGDPLINIDIPHEFPRPFDLVLEQNQEVASRRDVLFFSSSSSLTIGPIPVNFSFTSYGHYETNVSFKAQLLSQQLQVSVTPSVQSTVNGTMRVGSATYALVEIKGTLVDTTLPLIVKQNFSSWPLIASSSMDFITEETNMNMTSKLARVTGTGPLSGEEILDYQTQWQYFVPYINRSEYEQTGETKDTTPPSFLPLPHHPSPNCRVIQVAGRKFNNPAFELEYDVSEPESIVQRTYRVGTYSGGNDIIVRRPLYGNRLVLPHSLVQGQRLYFTISVENSNGLITNTVCRLPAQYDSSPPLANIVPIALHTSHPRQFEVLLSLFDESELLSRQEISLSTEPNEDDIVSWRYLNTSLINTLPDDVGLSLYSFPRTGRFIESILSAHTDIDTPLSCADLCTDHTHCLSFDHSVSQKRCILHDNTLGPSSNDNSFVNAFHTEQLQISSDFKHYQRLGFGNSTLFTFNNLTLQHRRTFYINLKLTNILGYTNSISSELISVDLTPPSPGLIRNPLSDILVNEGCGFNGGQVCDGPTTLVNNHRVIIDGPGSATVFNGPIQLYDALYTRASTFLTANWDGFVDRESSISSYTWCISSATNYTCDILPSEDPHDGQTAQHWTNTGLAKIASSLPDGSYYMTVDAINGASYGGSLVTTVHHSTPYIVDRTPPVIEAFDVVSYDSHLNVLNISFLVSDSDGSGVQEVSVGIGATKDDVDILPWTTLPSNGSDGMMIETSVSGVIVPDGRDGWVKLQVLDKVNLRAVMSYSTPINVDRTPPVAGTLYDGEVAWEDSNYQSNSSFICVSWRGFYDPHSDISDYQWKVGLYRGDNSTIALRNLTERELNDKRACQYDGVSLVHGTTYYSTLIVTNEASLSVEGYSDGITIDLTPPMAGTVRDGNSGVDQSYSSSLTHASFSWDGFNDNESPIQHYKLSIYRRPINTVSRRLVHSEILEETITEYSSNHFSFSNGDFVTANVEAYNSAGLSVNSTSNGYLIDLTPPLLTYLVDGRIDRNTDLIYQSSTDSLTVSWSATDPESSITQINIAFFQLIEGQLSRIYPNPALVDQSTVPLPIYYTNYTATGLVLANGVKYICRLTLTNGAGLNAVYETNGITIDTMVPVVGSVSVLGEEYEGVVSTGSKEVRVELLGGSDEGSGIDSYTVSLLTASDDMIVASSSFREKGGIITGLNLAEGNRVDGPFYKVRVIAIDHANLSSVAVDSMPFWVSGEDSIGIVNDGPIPQVDTDYTDEYYSISASFNGFISRDCRGGFVDYQWAIGLTDDREAVLPFTEQGIVLTGEGTGHAQIHLPDLDRYDSSLLLVTFRGITGCGQTFESVSDGFIISVNSPSVSVLQTGPFSIESPLTERPHEIYQSIDSFSSVWSINGKEGGGGGEIDTVVTIGSYPGGSDLLNETQANYGYIRQYIKGVEGTPNYVTVSATNRAGLIGVGYSEPIVLDTSLPPNGKIYCTEVLQSSSCTVGTPWQVSCTWNGTYDLQSGIKRYNISLSTDKLDQSRIFFKELNGSETSFVSPVLTINPNRLYYVTLYIENGAGLVNILTSMLRNCDTTPPVGSGSVKIVPNYGNGSYSEGTIDDKFIDNSSSAVCLWYTNTFSINFSPFNDVESGIKEYQLGIGTSKGSDDILKYSIVTPSLSSPSLLSYQVTNVTLSGDYRRPLYFTIRAINNAFLHTDLTSNAVYIKPLTNQGVSWVYDGTNPLVDIDFQKTTTYISGTFHYGVNCPLKSLQWAVEGTDGTPIKNFTDVPIDGDGLQMDFSFGTDQIRLYNEETYRLIVRGIDYSDEVHIFRSDGTAVTLQLLQIGEVLDADPLNLVFQDSLSNLTLVITGFGDGSPQQQVLFYEAAVGSNPDYIATRSDIVPFTNIGLQTTFTFSNLDLVSRQPYYVTVRAHSVSGSVAQVTSNGIIPGYGRDITAGTITQPLYQSNTTYLRVHWNGFNSDVPLLYYEWAIANYKLNSTNLLALCEDGNEGSFVRDFENVQLSTYASASRLSLSHGSSYYVVIRVFDQAGKCKTIVSEAPTVIDTTQPLGNRSIIGPIESRTINSDQYIAYVPSSNNQQLSLHWDEFRDPESPVESYQVGLFKLLSCQTLQVSSTPVVNYVPVGLSNSYTFNELQLETNVTYVVRILATNKAGLTGSILTQPVLLDPYRLTSGVVKDGASWYNDGVFQSDLSTLSGVLSLAYIRPRSSDGKFLDTPCPPAHTYTLTTTDSDWTDDVPTTIDGIVRSSIRYDTSQVTNDTKGTQIIGRLDPTRQQLVSGIYSTVISSSLERTTVSLNIGAGIEYNDLQPFLITSVIFLDDMDSSVLVDYDPLSQPFVNSFNAIGLQLHNSYNDSNGRFHQQKIVLWSKSEDDQSVQSVSSNVSINLSTDHYYSIRFTSEQLGLTFKRKVEVYIDGVLFVSLFGVPNFSNSSRMIFHVFNRHGNLPPCDPATCGFSPPSVTSLFSNVSLHVSTGRVCDYGRPFYSWGSPIIRLEAGIGTQPGYTDVKDYEVISTPCFPCQSVSCFQYGCSPSCPLTDDPSIITFTFSYNNNDSNVSSSGDKEDDESHTLSELLEPGVYYITVRATSGSGQVTSSYSNGILIDVTPPVVALPIQHYDVSFSTTQPTSYQGNNHTIAASWSFIDPESGIIDYQWAIGTTQYGVDIQPFTSVGLSTRVQNDSLEIDLQPNVKYYVSVLVTNGAGLSKVFTSDGVTYLLIELNRTQLDLITAVQHVDTIPDIVLNGKEQTVYKGNRDDRAGIEWYGLPSNISSVFWYIGSEPLQADILPSTDVSYNNGHMATISEGVTLYIDNVPFSNVSDILSIADGSDPSNIDGLFFEPGRLFYHTLEFCTFAHNCEKSDSRPAIIIRQDDAQQRSISGDDISVTLTQTNPSLQNMSVLDNNYTLTLTTNGGLLTGTMLYAGFLSERDVTRTYRVNVPYISNPYTTLGRTSRDIARRLVAIGGPSFYVSLLGQDNLNGELSLNVSYDTTLDWSQTEPRLVYWDIDVNIWREVKNTCGTESRIDYTTGTISVDVCSTVLPGSDTSNRPSVLTRRRRETESSGAMMNSTMLQFLDRPTHFVVMQFGNFSLNTPPQLQLPSLLELNEDVPSFTYTIPFTDSEGDAVLFYLRSVPRLGTATIDSNTGVLTYIPCRNCTGIENLQIYIVERELEFGTELSDSGVLQLRVNNIDDRLEIFLYNLTNNILIHDSNTLTVYVPANSTQPVTIARVGSYDVDGYHDDMEVFVTQGSNGASSYVPFIDVVAVPESLPVDWGQLPIGNFTGYVAFLGASVTYLPNEMNAIRSDRLTVYSQQEDNTLSSYLYINIEVIPSWCVNGGTCNGSVSDVTCSNVTARRLYPGSYTCTCPSGYTGDYCQIATSVPSVVSPDCPNNIPLFNCGGNPCDGASCPGHPTARCVPDYCGHCHAQWFVGDNRVTCTAADSNVCNNPASDLLLPFCSTLGACDCPVEHYTCPEDSVFIEQRLSSCCVTYTCQCPPTISCPYLMDCGHGVQPIPNYRGGLYPGRCCPEYSFEDINECEDTTVKTCSDICVNEEPFFSCRCPSGKTLASDKRTCGVCHYNGLEYLHGDTVKIGCNWCDCQSDSLSGERWHCTAHACTPGCYYDGVYYSVNSKLSLIGAVSCTCASTDKFAEWSCN